MLYKNEFKRNFIKYFWHIFWYEFKKIVFIILFEQSTLKGLKIFLKQSGKNRLKRKYIFNNICKVAEAAVSILILSDFM